MKGLQQMRLTMMLIWVQRVVLELEDSLNGCKIMSSGKLSLQQVFFLL